MSRDQVQIRFTRGGREYRRRSFTVAETQQTSFGRALHEEGVTAGLGHGFEVYVSPQDGENEISAHNKEEMTLESVLRAASEDGEITGKSFIVDCTTEHRGAERGCAL